MATDTKLLKKEELLTGKAFRISIASYFVSNIMTVLGSVIDGFVVGNTMDADAIAASGLVSPVIILFAFIGTTAGISLQDGSLRYLSRGDTEGAGRALTETLIIGVGLSVILMAAAAACTGGLIRHIGVSPYSASYPLCIEYIRGAAAGLPAMTAMAILTRGVQVDGNHRISLIAVAVMAVSNLLGDLICVYFTENSLFDIALGTSVSYYAGTAVLVWYYRKPDVLIRPRIKGISPGELLRINKIGMWGGTISLISGLSLVLRAEILNAAISWFAVESTGLQAYNVQVQMNYIISVFQNSAVSALFLFGALFTAEEDRVGFKKVMRKIAGYDTASAAAISLVMFLFADGIASLYLGNAGKEVISDTAGVLRAVSVGLIFQMIVLLFANYIQLFRHRIIAILTILFSNVIVPLYGTSFGAELEKILSGHILVGMFGGITAGHIITVMLLPLLLPFVNRRIGGKDYFWMIPPSFGTAPENELRAHIASQQEVMDFAERSWEFCEEKGESQRISYLTSLAVEEMATNVVAHGFNKDDKDHILDIRIVYKSDELILRFRDDCPGFDPRKKYESVFGSGDVSRMIGLRMIMAEAEEVSYTSMLNLNNLIIRIVTAPAADHAEAA